jgi:prepilin-type N-terminal cleavage/methylation domain-containing protein
VTRPRLKPPAGFSLVEVLLALSILALLLTSVGVAVRGSLQDYTENALATDLAQASRMAIDKITRDVRTAYDVDSGSGILAVYSDSACQNGTIYQFANGELRQIPLTNGVQGTASTLIGGDGEIAVSAFTVVREENAQAKTVSACVYLKLTSGAVVHETTSSAAVRKNQTY